MNAVSGTVLIFLLLVVCFAPRRWALLAMMAGVFFLTQGHSVDLAGLNIYPVRFLEATALGRVLVRRELAWSQLNRIDGLLLLLYNYMALVWILRSSELSAHQFASALDPTVCYLALRALIRTADDLRWLLNAFVVLLVPFTALVFLERLTGRNSFTLVGAAPEVAFRNAAARCQGSFRHAILLGSVAASFLPLYIGLWRTGARRGVAGFGGCLCLILVALSNSGGPVISVIAVAAGWSLWLMREQMHVVRIGALGLFLLLLLFMKAPIWYLPFKLSGIVGGGGYHRSRLLEHAWMDLDQWWLAGMENKDTAHWFPYVLEEVGGADVTNQFLLFGIRGGIPAIALSVILLTFAFKGIGSALVAVRRYGEAQQANQFLLWGIGVTLFVHAVSWLSVAYFDQSWVVWLMQLAGLSSSVQEVNLRARERNNLPTVPADLASARLKPSPGRGLPLLAQPEAENQVSAPSAS